MTELFPATHEIVRPSLEQNEQLEVNSSDVVLDVDQRRQALKWALKNGRINLEELQGLHDWTEYGDGVRGITSHENGQNCLIIREVVVDNAVQELIDELTTAQNEVDEEAANQIERANTENKFETDLKKNRWHSSLLALGDAAIGGAIGGIGATASFMTFAAPAIPVAVSVMAGGTLVAQGIIDGVQGYRKDKHLKTTHEQNMADLTSEELPVEAEEWFEQLEPLLVEAKKALIDDDPDDVVIRAEEYVVPFRHVKARIRLPGGPRYEDYEDVIEGLKQRSNGKKYVFRPAQEIEKLLADSNAAVWHDGKMIIKGIGDAQTSRREKQLELNALRSEWEHNPGLDYQEARGELERDIKLLGHTIELSLLNLYKLRADQLEASSPDTEQLVDPYRNGAANMSAGTPVSDDSKVWSQYTLPN